MSAWHTRTFSRLSTPCRSTTSRTGKRVALNGANSNLYRICKGFGGITPSRETRRTATTFRSRRACACETVVGCLSNCRIPMARSTFQSGDLGSTNQQGSATCSPIRFNPKYDRGSGVIDRRNVFNANYIYNFASFQDQGCVHAHLTGWLDVLRCYTVAQIGNPVNGSPIPLTRWGLGGSMANRPSFDPSRSYPHKQLAWFNTGAYSAPVAPWDWRT